MKEDTLNTKKIIVGNKQDLAPARQIEKITAEKFAKVIFFNFLFCFFV